MNTKFIKQSDFNQFDWKRLRQSEHSTNGDNYSFGKGGNGYPGGNGWHIQVFDFENEIDECWELPEVISRFIDWSEKNGGEQKRNEIRRVLGL